MNKSDTINELVLAMSKAQGEMGHASKDALNPHFKSKFSSLASVIDAVRDAFTKNGLAFFHSVSADGAIVRVTCTIAHSSGQWISSEFCTTAQDSKPQSIGSAISYGKRYTLQGLAGIASADDDDGEHAQGRPQIRPVHLDSKPGKLRDAYNAVMTKPGMNKEIAWGLASEATGYQIVTSKDIRESTKEADEAKIIAKWESQP